MGCMNNMRQLGLATLNRLDVKKDIAPARMYRPGTTTTMHGYFPHLLPYIEEAALADRYDLSPNVRWDAAVNQPIIKITIPVFVCPSVGDQREAVSDYAVVLGPTKEVYEAIRKTAAADLSSIVLDHAYRKLKGIKDGMSHSILIAECAGRPQRYEKGKFIPSNGNLLERAGRIQTMSCTLVPGQ